MTDSPDQAGGACLALTIIMKTLLSLFLTVCFSVSLAACGSGQTTTNSIPKSDCQQLIDNVVRMVVVRVPMSKRSAFEDELARGVPTQVRKCEAANISPVKMQCALAARTPQALDACKLK